MLTNYSVCRTIGVLAFSISVLFSGFSHADDENIPDFAAFTDVKEKKKVFFDFIYERIEAVNLQVVKQRKSLLSLKARLADGKTLSASDTDLLATLCAEYSRDCGKDQSQSIDLLLTVVDIVPPSLALAQAANESAWGTSRFAKKANNYFGQWCFTKGCGLVPNQRDAGSSHEVRKFDSVADSVAGYVKNLNTGSAYTVVRSVRAKARENSEQPTGVELAQGLEKYSARGQEYIKELRSMIRYNKLEQYDEKFFAVCDCKS